MPEMSREELRERIGRMLPEFRREGPRPGRRAGEPHTDLERNFRAVLERHRLSGNQAAQLLGIHRVSLHLRLRRKPGPRVVSSLRALTEELERYGAR